VSYPVTLSTLIQRVRQRSNLEGAVAFLPDSEVIDNLNLSLADWYDLVVGSTWGGTYYRVPWPITTQGNVSSYPLAPNCYDVISVDCLLTGNQTISAQRYQEENRNIFKQLPLVGWMWNQPCFYQLQGQNINFMPMPQSAFSVTVNYIPTAPVLSNYSDTLDSINGWEEYIVLDSAVKCLIKYGRADIIPMLEVRRQEQKARIVAAAPKRDLNQSEGVHETGRWGSLDDVAF
jgi:hypothetical protein